MAPVRARRGEIGVSGEKHFAMHSPMSGQSFVQSGIAGWSGGQQSMPSIIAGPDTGTDVRAMTGAMSTKTMLRIMRSRPRNAILGKRIPIICLSRTRHAACQQGAHHFHATWFQRAGSGSWMETLRPPRLRLARVILPPCSVKIAFAIVSPRPLPPVSRLREPSTR